MFGFGKATNSGARDDEQIKREGALYADAFSQFVKKQITKTEPDPTSEGLMLIAGGLGLMEAYGK